MRAFLFDRAGEVLDSGSHAYDTAYPQPGWAEQRPEDWIDAVRGSVKAALSGAAGADVAGLCAATTSCTVVCCDGDGNALAPAILWMDVRASAQMHAVLEQTGQSISAETFLCKALWIKENRPDLWARTRVLCEYQDYLNHWLTGEWCFSANTA